eukprot:CAMPEP_0198276534 /NCGR_PEP_ID=MMETSP1447-20131203/65362_1 /TAXON_ID=420782 /ORGANISM="Chaetoceros dichaeta, Strain CCMP1751" /LENGTH=147 /DNA_ID=CAMNT_0043971491 /DNA_START=461 /DNA_END=904 /DNA_ORIENTATION=+
MAKRLQKELASLQRTPIPNVTVSIPSEENVNIWSIVMKGPASTPYADGKFEILFTFPSNYPFKAPQILFQTKIYHPNVNSATGEICADIINEGWGPTLNVRHCITELQNILANPNADSPLVETIAAEFRDKPKQFEKTAKKWTKEHA